MIARVVPVQRIRRATTSWSYIVPARTSLSVGSLITVPFRGRQTLAVVWELVEHDTKATEEISSLVTSYPLLRQPQRQLVEWLADTGFISLSTALYTVLPAALRRYPLTKPALALLKEHGHALPSSATDLAQIKQQLALIPANRPQASTALTQKLGDAFWDTFQPLSETAELSRWLAVAQGKISVVSGRERALFAPFANLRHIRLTDPEDIAYYRDQLPLLSLVDAATALGRSAHAELSMRSQLPNPTPSLIWGNHALGNPVQATVVLEHLQSNQVLSDTLLTKLRALPASATAVLLYNAHDRKVQLPNHPDKLLLPGIESVKRELSRQTDIHCHLLVGTRELFQQLPTRYDFSAVLALDPLLHTESFADELHGLGDLGRLLARPGDCLIQHRQADHPLLHALRNQQFSHYCSALITQRQAAALPPFRSLVAVSLPQEHRAAVATLRQTLEPLLAASEWRLSHPFRSRRWKKEYVTLALVGNHQPLPAIVRKELSKLSRPWKVEYNPWHLL